MHTTVDTIKAIFTFATASAVALGGMTAIFFLPPQATDTKVVLAGFVGASLQFMFGQESSTRAARAAQAVANGHTP